ncbi:MAG: class I SAM-dependent methyltransferase [Rickettsiales bacterium]|jgi:SAM-dependent methyltransferase|nr:class I SAM-dependent methyltransferase [Rickettsiales bacterium]
MKNSDFDYRYQYGNWHSDTPESRRQDIFWLKELFGRHAAYPAEKNAAVLDIGCGMGRLLLMLKEAGYENLTGVDLDASQVEAARKDGVDARLADANEFLKGSREKYGAIYAFDILEHVGKDKIVPLLRLMRGRLSEDGFVCLEVPNAMTPLANWVRYGDFTHTVSYTPSSVTFLLRNSGFHFSSCRPQYRESAEIRALKLPWARLYLAEMGMRDPILTPNLIVFAFKSEAACERWKKEAPEIANEYAAPRERRAGFFRRLFARAEKRRGE